MSGPVRLLCPPVVTVTAFERFEINKAIDGALKKDVAYIHAPAGFGKTVAMSMWLARKQCNAAWIPFTVYDDSPSVFCRYLITALFKLEAGLALCARDVLNNPGFDSAPFEYLFKALASTAGSAYGGIIVLDDFHQIQNEAILKAMPMIIKKLLPTHKFAILSRLKPPATFSDMAVKHLIGEVTEHELRFTRLQIVRLYKACGIELSPADAAEIEAKTGGWALGLGARLIFGKSDKTESMYCGDSGRQYISQYLKNEIWDKWDDSTREFLIKTSMLEDLPVELCDTLCNCDSRQTLTALAESSGLVIRLSDGLYRYHHILRDFLRQQAAESRAALSRCYVIAADYMHKKGKLPAALDYYKKSADSEALSAFLYSIFDYDNMNSSIEDIYDSFLFLKELPAETIENDLPLLTLYACISYTGGNFGQFKSGMARLNAYMENCTNVSPRTVAGALLLQFANPLIPAREIEIKEIFGKFELQSIPALSITFNLPYLHRSHRDYSDIANDWAETVPVLAERFKAIAGDIIDIYMNGVAGGLLYEQNKLARAREYMLKAHSRLADKINPELRFAVQMHIALIFFAEGDEKNAWDAIAAAQVMMDNSSALYHAKNLNAIITKYRLYKGDINAAREWLSSYMVSDTDKVTLFQLYQILTTIRAKITLGEFASALMLISSAERIAVDFCRPLDEIELYILRAVVYWKEKRRSSAVDAMEKAVMLAKPYGYIRLFANEGAAVITMLQKLYGKVSAVAAEPELLCFIHELIICASENAEVYPGMASSAEEELVKLSKQQAIMLSHIAGGKNIQQICKATGLKRNTVKAHLYKLYEKLEVNNATEAVLKAYRIKLLEKKE
ncbi:MAG: HTH-type transcriptional regulator MalT [Firmicutes bacterium ADurb.Bin182]|nr:MAG: HTH-type transcriptional regulator MalT [Firmicutes bacterium ADurb.Bin182]